MASRGRYQTLKQGEYMCKSVQPGSWEWQVPVLQTGFCTSSIDVLNCEYCFLNWLIAYRANDAMAWLEGGLPEQRVASIEDCMWNGHKVPCSWVHAPTRRPHDEGLCVPVGKNWIQNTLWIRRPIAIQTWTNVQRWVGCLNSFFILSSGRRPSTLHGVHFDVGHSSSWILQ